MAAGPNFDGMDEFEVQEEQADGAVIDESSLTLAIHESSSAQNDGQSIIAEDSEDEHDESPSIENGKIECAAFDGSPIVQNYAVKGGKSPVMQDEAYNRNLAAQDGESDSTVVLENATNDHVSVPAEVHDSPVGDSTKIQQFDKLPTDRPTSEDMSVSPDGEEIVKEAPDQIVVHPAGDGSYTASHEDAPAEGTGQVSVQPDVDLGGFHSIHHAAWTAAVEGHECTTIHAATVANPKIMLQPPARFTKTSYSASDAVEVVAEPDVLSKHPPPAGFILNGTIKLFGIDSLKADFYSHHAPTPSSLHDSRVPIYQIAILEDDLRLSSFLPEFAGTNFDIIAFKNVTFTYQNKRLDKTKSVGFQLDADVVFDKSYGQVYDVLSQFLGIADPTLHLKCGLGVRQDWHRPLWVPGFSLEGVFPHTSASPCKGVVLTSVGLRLIGFHVMRYEEGQLKTGKEFGFSVFGSMHLDVPGRSIPLELLYEITEMCGSLSLSAQVECIWEHAFGIKDLKLQEVSFSADFDLSEPLESLTFSVSAVLEAEATIIYLYGSYSTQGNFSLSATVEKLGFDGLNNLFSHLSDGTLSKPDVDIHLGSATLTISKDSGLNLVLHDLQIGEHDACDGTVEIGSNGVLLRASMEGDALVLNDVHILKASVEVNFGREDTGSKTSVMIGGEFKWKDFEFEVGVHLYKSPEGKDGLEYTIYGQFADTVAGEGLPLVKLVPELSDTFMKTVTLQGAAIIIASRDDADFGALNHAGYPVQRGFQACATLQLHPVKTLMRVEKPPDLTLRASWSEKTGFELDVLCEPGTTLHLGRGITTDPIDIKITLGANPALMVIVGANIPVQNQPDPLHFNLDITLGEFSASAAGKLSGGWKNPFGISDQLTIGPDLALSISILYETFLELGPSGFGFVGGLQMGKVNGQLSIEVNEMPSQEILSAKIEHLDVQDLVALTNVVTKLNLAKPSNVISFEEVNLYICPAGVTIANIDYPKGCSFKAHVVLFGKHADVDVVIGDGGAHCKGGIDNFTLGPLTVRGTTGPRASFDVEFSDAKQGGTIDGMVTIFDVDATLKCTFDLHPAFSFEFDFNLKFSDLFEFNVHAAPETPLSEESPGVSDTEYKLTASFHEEIRGHIAGKINQMLKERAARDSESAQAVIDLGSRSWQDNVDALQAHVDATHASWSGKSAEMHQYSSDVEATVKAKIAALQHESDVASAEWKLGVAAAQVTLSTANADRAARLKADANALSMKKVEWAGKLDDAHRAVDKANQTLHSGFGDVDHAIDQAKERVDSLQATIDGVLHHISECEDASCWDLPAKAAIPGLCDELRCLQASKEFADGLLDACKAVIEAEDYLARKDLVRAALLTVDETKVASDKSLTLLQEALDVTDKSTNEVVDAASRGLHELSDGAVKSTSSALEDYKLASIKLLEGAQNGVDELKTGGEWLAYEFASDLLTAAKTSGSGALLLLKGGVEVGEATKQAYMKMKTWVASDFLQFVDITDVTLTSQLGKACEGITFSAQVNGTIGGDTFFTFKIDFSMKKETEFITQIFDKLLHLVEERILDEFKEKD